MSHKKNQSSMVRETKYSESDTSVSFTIPRPSRKYFDDFLRLQCATDMIEDDLFPNAKEITESFAAYHAVKNLLNDTSELGNPNINVICVGDGRTPRTGAVFAYRSRWSVWSIDPQMKVRGKYKGIERLTCIPEKIENHAFDCDFETYIVCVHSHASIEATLDAIKAPVRHLITMPCCVPHGFSRIPDRDYEDWGVWSPDRRVMVWQNI